MVNGQLISTANDITILQPEPAKAHLFLNNCTDKHQFEKKLHNILQAATQETYKPFFIDGTRLCIQRRALAATLLVVQASAFSLNGFPDFFQHFFIQPLYGSAGQKAPGCV